MNCNGTNKKVIGYGSQMSWHPDGKKIVFSHMPFAELGGIMSYIYIYNVDGTSYKRLSDIDFVRDESPSFSPDGKLIAFASNRDNNGKLTKTEIYTMDENGGNLQRISFSDQKFNFNPIWSLDGRKIIYNTDGRIAQIDLVEKKVEIIASLYKFVLVNPCISPDGEKIILLARSTDGTEKSYLYMMNKNGTMLRRVIDDDVVESCDWSK